MSPDKPKFCQYKESAHGPVCGRKLYVTDMDFQHCIFHSEDIPAKAKDLKLALDELLQKHEMWLDMGIGEQANITGAILEGVSLEKANLQRANLPGARLQHADLQGVNLSGANLLGASLHEAILLEANLSGANLQKAVLLEADLQEANLQKANLREANLQKAILEWAKLEGANLRGANLQEADLLKANLRSANLQRAKLLGADLQEATFDGADLEDADLQETKLLVANLSLSNLKGAFLREANLIGANLLGADLENVHMESILAGPDIFVQVPTSIRQKYEESWRIYGADRLRTIVRTTELLPDDLQAGLSILNYFSIVLKQKFPDKRFKMTLEQDGLKVSMIVETEYDDRDMVEKLLVEYGGVVGGERTIDQFFADPAHASALQRSLEQTQAELGLTYQMQSASKKPTKSRLKSMENDVKAFCGRMGKTLSGALAAAEQPKPASKSFLFSNSRYREFIQNLFEQNLTINSDLLLLSQKLSKLNPDERDVETVKELLLGINKLLQVNARKTQLLLNNLLQVEGGDKP